MSTKKEFGDFQTPLELAAEVASCVRSLGFRPQSIVEPTCGKGNILFEACKSFPKAKSALGVEISHDYFEHAVKRFKPRKTGPAVEIVKSDFFQANWSERLGQLPDPILVIGNPPWVTNSELGMIGSDNLPIKTNLHKLSGFDAKTGKSNFDISEWMLIKATELLAGRDAILAMLCKTAVARKLIKYIWNNQIDISLASLFRIDAPKHFDASVDACLIVLKFGRPASHEAQVFKSFDSPKPEQVMGYRNGELVASVKDFDSLKHLRSSTKGLWRSGVKHDCSKVMELRQQDGVFINGFGDAADIETDFVFPLLKSSDLGKESAPTPRRWVIVTQRNVGDDTMQIRDRAPKTWEYLLKYADLLDGRKSSIYSGRPRFAVFGIGDYSYSPWKVAISGFYKSLIFHVVGPYDGKPVMLDDTCYSISPGSKEDTKRVGALLNSTTARTFFSSLAFWDAKRPVTVDLLNSLDLASLNAFLKPDDTSFPAMKRNDNQVRKTIAKSTFNTMPLFSTIITKNQ